MIIFTGPFFSLNSEKGTKILKIQSLKHKKYDSITNIFEKKHLKIENGLWKHWNGILMQNNISLGACQNIYHTTWLSNTYMKNLHLIPKVQNCQGLASKFRINSTKILPK